MSIDEIISAALAQPVRVFADRYSPEYSGLSAQKEREVPRDKWGTVTPFLEAVRTRYTTPAELQLIAVPGVKVAAPDADAPARYPRVGRKWALNLWRDEVDPAIMPGSHLVILDVDHGDKANSTWSQRQARGLSAADTAFFTLLQRLRDRHGFGWYLTNSGARCFGVAPRWLSIDVFEDYIVRFQVALARDGFPVGPPDRALMGVADPYGHHVDPACYDMGRMHKLPQVPGASGATSGLTWLEPTVRKLIDFDPPALLAWSFGGKSSASLLTASGTPPVVESPKRADFVPLKGLACYDLLASPGSIGTPGNRHDPMLRVAGAVAAKLDTSDAARVYQLCLPCVRASLVADDDEAKLLRDLWAVAQYVCAGQAEVAQQTKNLAYARGMIRRESLAKIAEINAVDHADAVRRIVLANPRGDAFVFDEMLQTYAPAMYDVSSIALALRFHCPNLVELRGERGAYLPDRTLALNYASPAVNTVRFVYGLNTSRYHHATRTIEMQAACISPTFKPTYNKTVDDWLKLLGGSKYADLLDWLSLFPHLQRPLCALYFEAEQGVGKNVFTQGLASLFNASPVPYESAGANFRKQLLAAPVLHVDESVKLSAFNNNSTSLFRQITGSKTHEINMKNVDPVELLGFPRVIITANTADALKIRENLTPADVEAIQVRVGFIKVPKGGAVKFIESLPLDTIELMMYRWLPEHVLWLRDNHKLGESKVTGKYRRFASWQSQEYATSVKLEIGETRVVGEAIARWYLRNPTTDPTNGVFSHEGEIYVSSTQLAKMFAVVMAGKGNKEPSSRELCAALTVLAPEGCDKPSGVFRFPGVVGTLRLWRIDPYKLRAIAESLDLDGDAFGARVDLRAVPLDDADDDAALDADLDFDTALDFAAAAFND